MPDNELSKILFIINPSSGNNNTNWQQKINDYLKNSLQQFKIFELSGNDNKKDIQKQISEYEPEKVVIAGGDGSVKMVAEILINTEKILGILPAGSANGMAADLGINNDADKALDVVMNGKTVKIDVLKINDNHLSIHLSDIGLNALLIHYFDKGNQRGMLGYAKVAFKVFLKKRLLRLTIEANGETMLCAAYMVAIANGKRYGTGAIINPESSLTDGQFELIIIKRLTLTHLFRMLVSHKPFSADCIETIHTKKAVITLQKKNHFQVDGEYCEKENSITAEIISAALKVLVPGDSAI